MYVSNSAVMSTYSSTPTAFIYWFLINKPHAAAFTVTIDTVPSLMNTPSLPVASDLTMTCGVVGGTAPFSYNWNSDCFGDCFVLGQLGSSSQVVSRQGLRSFDAGNHTCIVTDDTSLSESTTVELKLSGTYACTYVYDLHMCILVHWSFL